MAIRSPCRRSPRRRPPGCCRRRSRAAARRRSAAAPRRRSGLSVRGGHKPARRAAEAERRESGQCYVMPAGVIVPEISHRPAAANPGGEQLPQAHHAEHPAAVDHGEVPEAVQQHHLGGLLGRRVRGRRLRVRGSSTPTPETGAGPRRTRQPAARPARSGSRPGTRLLTTADPTRARTMPAAASVHRRVGGGSEHVGVIESRSTATRVSSCCRRFSATLPDLIELIVAVRPGPTESSSDSIRHSQQAHAETCGHLFQNTWSVVSSRCACA